MHSFSVTSANIAINDVSQKNKILWTTFPSETETIFNHFDVIGPKATKFGEKVQDNGHYAV